MAALVPWIAVPCIFDSLLLCAPFLLRPLFLALLVVLDYLVFVALLRDYPLRKQGARDGDRTVGEVPEPAGIHVKPLKFHQRP